MALLKPLKPPPIRTPFIVKGGPIISPENAGQASVPQNSTPHFAWQKWFQNIPGLVNGAPQIADKPVSSSAAGSENQLHFDTENNFIYVYKNGSWKRAPFAFSSF